MSRKIEIRTAQQVVLSYDLASAGSRFLATLMDLFLTGLLMYVIYSLFPEDNLLGLWISFIILTFYHLIFEAALNGRSPGKMMGGIRVMRTDGAPLELTDCFLRWIMRPLDLLFSFGALGLFMILGTEKRQRLGDLMAGTAVVTKKHSLHYSFSDLITLHERREGAEITWPQLRHIEEKHILFIKNLLGSRDKYAGDVYRKTLEACSRKMADLLELAEIPADRNRFLQQVVNEYIVLTR